MIMAVVGGTVSELTGGKFANGAVSGAFVHLFNAEGGTLSKIWKGLTGGISKVYDRRDEILSDAGKGLKGLAKNAPRAVQNAHPAAKAVLVASGAQVILGGIYGAEAAYYNAMANPRTVFQFTEAALNPAVTVPAMSTRAGQLGQAVGWTIRQVF